MSITADISCMHTAVRCFWFSVAMLDVDDPECVKYVYHIKTVERQAWTIVEKKSRKNKSDWPDLKKKESPVLSSEAMEAGSMASCCSQFLRGIAAALAWSAYHPCVVREVLQPRVEKCLSYQSIIFRTQKLFKLLQCKRGCQKNTRKNMNEQNLSLELKKDAALLFCSSTVWWEKRERKSKRGEMWYAHVASAK